MKLRGPLYSSLNKMLWSNFFLQYWKFRQLNWDFTCKQKQLWHRAGEKKWRKASEPALPVLFCLWQLHSPSEEAFFLHLNYKKFSYLSSWRYTKPRHKRKRQNLLIIFLHFFLVGFFFSFVLIFFYYAVTNATRHARTAGGLLTPANVRIE